MPKTTYIYSTHSLGYKLHNTRQQYKKLNTQQCRLRRSYKPNPQFGLHSTYVPEEVSISVPSHLFLCSPLFASHTRVLHSMSLIQSCPDDWWSGNKRISFADTYTKCYSTLKQPSNTKQYALVINRLLCKRAWGKFIIELTSILAKH